MSKFEVAKQLYGNHTSAWVFSSNFATYFQNIFFLEDLRRAAYGWSNPLTMVPTGNNL